LAGDDGIQPVRLAPLMKLAVPVNFNEIVESFPSLVQYNDVINLSAYHCTEALVVLGMIISCINVVTPVIRGTLTLTILWICYFSIVKVVAAFSHWRWSILLAEVGFLCILLSIKLRKCAIAPNSRIVSWLLRWLLFRVTFATGFIKLSQRNSDWWNLSALQTFFQTQLSPTPLAYYLTILPDWMLKLMCAIAVSAELILPFLFLVPLRFVEMFAFVTQFVLQVNLLLTGNYSILNVLMIFLCFSLLSSRRSKVFGMRTIASAFLSFALIGSTAVVFGTMFAFKFADSTIGIRFAITYNQFSEFSRLAILYIVPVAASLFAWTVLCSFYEAIRTPGCFDKLQDLTAVLMTAILATGLFLASVPSFSALNGSINSLVPVPAFLQELKPLYLANDYRYFHQDHPNLVYKSSTEGRPTLVLEGSMSETGPWKELSFFHAPGKVDRMPAIIPGHSPAVDFELGLAATQTFDKSPFVSSLVYRILSQQKDVVQQMELTGFASGPKYISIKVYNYKFSPRVTGKDWWTKSYKSLFLRPTSLNSPHLTKLVAESIGLGKRRERPNDTTHLSFALDQMRALVGQPRDLTPFIVVVASILLLRKLIL